MIGTLDRTDDVTSQADRLLTAPDEDSGVIEALGCHGCGAFRPDVDLWAINPESGEELWLCLDCGL
jgi:hypothetical protein